LLDDLVHAARGGGRVALDGEEGPLQRHRDLALIERNGAAGALEDGIARLAAWAGGGEEGNRICGGRMLDDVLYCGHFAPRTP